MSTTNQSSNTISTVALERELSQITNINNILLNFHQTIQKVNHDLNSICNSTTNSRILMNKWTDIMSQTDFTLDAINNPSWDPRKLEQELNNNKQEDQEVEEEDDDEDEDVEQKLENELHRIEQENSELSKTIENIAKEKNTRMNKRNIDGSSTGYNGRRKLHN
ncbi:hypothetical protein K6H09_000238 [Candida tropicalis]